MADVKIQSHSLLEKKTNIWKIKEEKINEAEMYAGPVVQSGTETKKDSKTQEKPIWGLNSLVPSLNIKQAKLLASTSTSYILFFSLYFQFLSNYEASFLISLIIGCLASIPHLSGDSSSSGYSFLHLQILQHVQCLTCPISLWCLALTFSSCFTFHYPSLNNHTVFHLGMTVLFHQPRAFSQLLDPR